MFQHPRAALFLCALSLFAAGEALGQQQTAAAGENIYDMNCAQCHGEKLANAGITFDLKRLKAADRPRFENSVLNGKGQMPPWRGVLKESDIEALWTYIRANANE